MGSTSNSLPIAWLDSDLTLSHMPKFESMIPRKKRRDKASHQLSRLLFQAPTGKKTHQTESPPTPVEALKQEAAAPSGPDTKATVNAALLFGMQISTLISQDRASLQPGSVESESPDSTVYQRKRALEHAKLVTEQMTQRSSKRRCTTSPEKTLNKEVEVFRFTELPSEIRDMIYAFYFTNSSGEKPRLMWAFNIDGVKIDGDFYNAAEKVYYTVNNWTFNVKDCLRNSILGNMDQFHVGMIKKMTIEIPKEIQACTKLSSALSRAVNVEDLTLSARSDTGIRRVLHEIMPGFKHVRRITLSIQCPKGSDRSRREQRRVWAAAEYYRIFRQDKEALDRVLGQEGRLIQETTRVQEWRWEAEGSKVFDIKCPKKHIKFD